MSEDPVVRKVEFDARLPHYYMLVRSLGLCSLGVETPGGDAGTSMGNATLDGLVDALGFRDAVLQQRDRVTSAGLVAAPPPSSSQQAEEATLGEIRDSLQRIEKLLETRLSDPS